MDIVYTPVLPNPGHNTGDAQVTKIANKKPAELRRPVRINKMKYELWYCKPEMLGEINRRGPYWYTEDGMRFLSSRDALSYLIKLVAVAGVDRTPEKLEAVRKQVEATRSRIVKKTRTHSAKKLDSRNEKSTQDPEISYNQNHPMFQKFLDFVEFQNRKKSEVGAVGSN